MGLIIDVTRAFQHAWLGRLPTGIDRVDLEYLHHFSGTGRALLRLGGRWMFLGAADSRKLFRALSQTGGVSRRCLIGCVLKSYVLSWRWPRAGAWLIHTGHAGLERENFSDRVRRYGLRPLYFLHDLIPIRYTEYCGSGVAVAHHRRLATLLETASAVLVNSQDTGRDLAQYATEEGCKVPAWTVAPLGIGRLHGLAGPRPLEAPYFVMLSTIEPRKNHLLLLHLWRELVAQLREHAPRLVVIGRRGWKCEQVFNMLDHCAALRGFVIELPRCGDDELLTWLSHAQALLFPSFAEGYGLPLVEAMSLGVPAIVSDIATFREVGRDIPEYVSPLDGLGWKRLILEYMDNDGAARSAQLARMKGYQAPTWEAHFQVVEGLLTSL
ncbi:MAG: glycosyltransferase family 4 protein [Pseudomonadales bacterium]|jgi:glycosyltransferase involved in cell wall biosynthesis|nr:glycosyltransferase family 4 protein [Pseudomonadales bacterium]